MITVRLFGPCFPFLVEDTERESQLGTPPQLSGTWLFYYPKGPPVCRVGLLDNSGQVKRLFIVLRPAGRRGSYRDRGYRKSCRESSASHTQRGET